MHLRKRILIVVKTYPVLDPKHDEVVCTAGIDEEGNWFRLYPIPFRQLGYEKRFQKYQWIEVDLIKNSSDPRPESYSPIHIETLKICDKIDTDEGFWLERREFVLKNIRYDFSELIIDAKEKNLVSLAVFKPKKILDLKIEEIPDNQRNRYKEKIKQLQESRKQLDLFNDDYKNLEVVSQIPFKFSYTLLDSNDIQHTLMIEDWELFQLYWNCYTSSDFNIQKAKDDVYRKYLLDFSVNKDVYFFLGTTRAHHFIGKNPFIIIGVFYPKFLTPNHTLKQLKFNF